MTSGSTIPVVVKSDQAALGRERSRFGFKKDLSEITQIETYVAERQGETQLMVTV